MIKVSVKIPRFPKTSELNSVIFNTCESWSKSVFNIIKNDASGRKLKIRSGKLVKGLFTNTKQTTNKTKINFGVNNIKYGEIHDNPGGITTIIPKNKKYLTVPVNRGVTKSARQYPGTFVFRSRRGNLIVAQRTNGGGLYNFKPLFVLKKSVRIKGTGYITNNVKDGIKALESSLKLNLYNRFKKL